MKFYRKTRRKKYVFLLTLERGYAVQLGHINILNSVDGQS